MWPGFIGLRIPAGADGSRWKSGDGIAMVTGNDAAEAAEDFNFLRIKDLLGD
jgi:hypothetical protein